MNKPIASVHTAAMPMLALRGLTVFPNMLVHFDVGRDKSIKALDAAMASDQMIFLVAQKDIRVDDPTQADLYKYGTVANVRQVLKLPGDNIRILVEGSHRARLFGILQTEPYFNVEIQTIEEPIRKVTGLKTEAALRRVQELFEEYAALAPRMSHEVIMNIVSATDLGYLADYIAQNIQLKYADKQLILEETNPLRRVEKVISLLVREIQILELEHSLQEKLSGQINKNQRDYYLREQMKIIQNELGDTDDIESEVADYTARILALAISEQSTTKLLKEANRLSKLQFGSPEAAVIRTYLDTCLDLPWHKVTKDRLDLKAAARVLDADHFGLEKVKERVLEFLAVKKLMPGIKGQIICLVGPPGVGKTSIGMSIARALGRKYARLSLGGVRDEADIRGHRKTYIGAMPGRIITAIQAAGSKNALLLLDEIDKLGHDFRGDPSAALLEVLDSEQNSAFRDHFIEIPFDLSEVMFVTTANSTDTIPRALLDRMEVIELTSYTDEEKLQIAKHHLIPKQLKRHGLSAATLRFSDDAVREIIAGYTRESGVRIMERELAAVCRKAAKSIAAGQIKRVTINGSNLEQYLGIRKYLPDRHRYVNEVGVANGLAWTSVGGEILEVEVGVVDGSGKMELTGNLGDVMKESAKAALTYIRSRQDSLEIDPDFYKKYDMHIHFPESAIPKDGPSAGITMAVALVSALTGAPVRRDVAMTGEITLRGRVLPIGGLKEKTMAAFRSGIKTVVIPADNEKDLEEIDQTVRRALNFIPAEHMDTVLAATIDFSQRTPPKKQKLPEEKDKHTGLMPIPAEEPGGQPFIKQ